jgi:hypothetical protein
MTAQQTTRQTLLKAMRGNVPGWDLLRLASHQDRSFSRKVHAFNAGLEHVRSVGFDVIGNLDADLSLAPDYVENS